MLVRRANLGIPGQYKSTDDWKASSKWRKSKVQKHWKNTARAQNISVFSQVTPDWQHEVWMGHLGYFPISMIASNNSKIWIGNFLHQTWHECSQRACTLPPTSAVRGWYSPTYICCSPAYIYTHTESIVLPPQHSSRYSRDQRGQAGRHM